MTKGKIHSFFDTRGALWVCCGECKRGFNGEKSCGAGMHRAPSSAGCFGGTPLPEVAEQLKAQTGGTAV